MFCDSANPLEEKIKKKKVKPSKREIQFSNHQQQVLWQVLWKLASYWFFWFGFIGLPDCSLQHTNKHRHKPTRHITAFQVELERTPEKKKKNQLVSNKLTKCTRCSKTHTFNSSKVLGNDCSPIVLPYLSNMYLFILATLLRH